LAEITFADVVDAPEGEREELIAALISRMTLKEKIKQMSGSANLLDLAMMLIRYNLKPYDSGRNRRLGIPPLRFTDGPRGVGIGHSTCFPVAIARGASWDADLQERISSAIGVEARAQGADFYGGVCINLLRHPGWGRAQETFGEDPHHLGVMGVAALKGAQKHLMACAKHFACNSIEESRFYVDVIIDERTLREVYLPHFKKCVDAGAASIMSAYNRVNGTYCGHSHQLLSEILKDDWGFDGFVMSDFLFGIYNGVDAANGGMDMEMPGRWRFGFGFARKVKRGLVPIERIDDAVARILRQKARFALKGDKSGYDKSAVGSRAHVALALEAARKSMVLLKNENGALPIAERKVSRMAIVGELATRSNIGDRGSSEVHPSYVVTPLEGLRSRAGGAIEVEYDNGSDLSRARVKAARADLVMVVVGLTSREEGEHMTDFLPRGGDREDLGLPADQEAIIHAVASENERCIVIVEGGSAVTMGSWLDEVEAVLMAWYPGMEGGTALAEILFGDVCPGGKLPVTFPASTEQLPFFDKKARRIEYGYYHGYRLFDREGLEPEFPFGFGLSYTSFAYGPLELSDEEIDPSGLLTATFDVTNTGSMYGEEVAQLYVEPPGTAVDRPVRELKGFARLPLEPGETATVSMPVDAGELAYYDVGTSSWSVEPGDYSVRVGSSSRLEDLRSSAGFRIRGD
jgi:beta-glucosidase